MLPEDFIFGTARGRKEQGRQASRILHFHPISTVWEDDSLQFFTLIMSHSWLYHGCNEPVDLSKDCTALIYWPT